MSVCGPFLKSFWVNFRFIICSFLAYLLETAVSKNSEFCAWRMYVVFVKDVFLLWVEVGNEIPPCDGNASFEIGKVGRKRYKIFLPTQSFSVMVPYYNSIALKSHQMYSKSSKCIFCTTHNSLYLPFFLSIHFWSQRTQCCTAAKPLLK